MIVTNYGKDYRRAHRKRNGVKLNRKTVHVCVRFPQPIPGGEKSIFTSKNKLQTLITHHCLLKINLFSNHTK